MKNSFQTIAVLLVALATSALADIIPAKSYTIPSPQDSSWDSPDRPDPAVRETDAGRWAIPLREVMQRTFDVSGQKSEWVLGTSILGHPELDPMAVGISSLSTRYPSKLAGLYTTRLGYDATTLTLNGENGILFEERHGIPIDTPITDLNWERSSFDGNALRLDFRRLVTDSVMLDSSIPQPRTAPTASTSQKPRPPSRNSSNSTTARTPRWIRSHCLRSASSTTGRFSRPAT